MLSNGPITQQFSIPEFVEMSLFSAEFLRHAGEHLKILGKYFCIKVPVEIIVKLVYHSLVFIFR